MAGQGQIRIGSVGPVCDAMATDVIPVWNEADGRWDGGPWARAIMGPWGSGKTGSALTAPVRRMFAQKPSPRDGKRYRRVLVVRRTYPELRSTTIASWLQFFPADAPGAAFRESVPPTYAITLPHADGGLCDFEMIFVALGDQRVEDALKGFEASEAIMDEADRLPEDVFTYLMGRVGRYPSVEHGGPGSWGVTCCYNAPPFHHWLVRTFDRPHAKETGFRFYRQPSGLSPLAENAHHHTAGRGYWHALARANAHRDWWVRRMIRNEYGYSREGKPVYLSEFSDSRHVSPVPLVANPLRRLGIGADAGATPAAIIGQREANGQWRVLRELVCPSDQSMGPKRLGQWINRVLAEDFPGFRPQDIEGWCDPSAAAFGPDENEQSWIRILANTTRIRFRGTRSNAPSLRLQAVRDALLLPIDGDTPGFLLDPSCEILRAGFNEGYRYRRQVGAQADGEYGDKPEKNSFSHPHDGLQYLVLGAGDYAAVLGRAEHQRRGADPRGRQTRAISEDEPQGAWAGAGFGGDRNAVDR